MVLSSMSWLLVVQPDAIQVDVLRNALQSHVSAIVVADSVEEALSAIDRDIPDVILLPTLIPAVEDHLVAYLATIPGAGHVQILGLPPLDVTKPSEPPRARWRFPWRRRRLPRAVIAPGCDPGVFTQDVTAYLAHARMLKQDADLYSRYAAQNASRERRSEPRFPTHDVPWISVVRFGSEPADLIDVSSRGALLRTHIRPEHALLRRSNPNLHRRPHVTLELESEREIHAVGRVIRCVPLATNARVRYEVAFAFDHSVGLHLPATGTALPTGSDQDDDVVYLPATLSA
jgi:CheY-like chemotaxis protein